MICWITKIPHRLEEAVSCAKASHRDTLPPHGTVLELGFLRSARTASHRIVNVADVSANDQRCSPYLTPNDERPIHPSEAQDRSQPATWLPTVLHMQCNSRALVLFRAILLE
jgi:hypothetical protein